MSTSTTAPLLTPAPPHPTTALSTTKLHSPSSSPPSLSPSPSLNSLLSPTTPHPFQQLHGLSYSQTRCFLEHFYHIDSRTAENLTCLFIANSNAYHWTPEQLLKAYAKSMRKIVTKMGFPEDVDLLRPPRSKEDLEENSDDEGGVMVVGGVNGGMGMGRVKNKRVKLFIDGTVVVPGDWEDEGRSISSESSGSSSLSSGSSSDGNEFYGLLTPPSQKQQVPTPPTTHIKASTAIAHNLVAEYSDGNDGDDEHINKDLRQTFEKANLFPHSPTTLRVQRRINELSVLDGNLTTRSTVETVDGASETRSESSDDLEFRLKHLKAKPPIDFVRWSPRKDKHSGSKRIEGSDDGKIKEKLEANNYDDEGTASGKLKGEGRIKKSSKFDTDANLDTKKDEAMCKLGAHQWEFVWVSVAVGLAAIWMQYCGFESA